MGDFAVILGPRRSSDVAIRARIRAEKRGRLRPTFGVGLGGTAGYKLLVAGNHRAVEIERQDSTVKKTSYEWKPGGWTCVHFALVAEDDGLVARGKVWPAGEEEPADWTIEAPLENKPPAGRPSLWGVPYSGKPIWFDDVVVRPVK